MHDSDLCWIKDNSKKPAGERPARVNSKAHNVDFGAADILRCIRSKGLKLTVTQFQNDIGWLLAYQRNSDCRNLSANAESSSIKIRTIK